MNLLSPEKKKETYDKLVYESGRTAYEIGLWFLDSNRASEADASKITCPVLVIGSAHDRMVPVSVVRKIASKYKNVATYREYADHAHKIILEPDWERVARDIDTWIKEVLPKN